MQDTQFKNQLIDIDLEGKTLPTVTAADEGKVLTVDSSGAWTAATGGGGGSCLVIIEPTQEDDGLYLGYSFADIQAALAAGSVLAEMKVTGNVSFNLCYLKVFGASSGTFFAEFTNGHTFSASSQTDPLIYQST